LYTRGTTKEKKFMQQVLSNRQEKQGLKQNKIPKLVKAKKKVFVQTVNDVSGSGF